MATSVTSEKEITLQDGKTISVRPLNIKNLRRFMEMFEEMGDIDWDEKGAQGKNFDMLIKLAGVALTKAAPEIADDEEYLEENLDLESIRELFVATAGIDLGGGDPNQTGTG